MRAGWSRCRASARRPPSACCWNSRASSAPTWAWPPASATSDAQADILQALVALGYSDKEAAASLKALPKDVGVSDGIKLALKALAKYEP